MCVCRVETPSARGTGFLIGPDIVITNHHVVQKVIDGSDAPEEVILRFDHKKLADGKTLDGTIYYMAKNDWLIDSSPPSPVDDTLDPKGALPREDELDYALLRAASAPGNEVLSGEGKSNVRLRSWIKIPTSPYHFESSTLLVILQYPLGDILKFALDTDSIIGLNANHTRLQYRTNTQPGSSGAPCFNSMLELVALHRGGSSTHNVGIPFFAIRSLLEKRGFKNILDQAAQ